MHGQIPPVLYDAEPKDASFWGTTKNRKSLRDGVAAVTASSNHEKSIGLVSRVRMLGMGSAKGGFVAELLLVQVLPHRGDAAL